MSESLPVLLPRFDANVLRLARAAFRGKIGPDIAKYAWTNQTAPPCLSVQSIELVKDTLRKGCLVFLTRAGGWRIEKNLQGKEGSIWKRTPTKDLPLHFSKQTLNLLIQSISRWPKEFADSFQYGIEEFTPADQLFALLLYQAARANTEWGQWLRQVPLIRHNPLVRLAFPDDFVEIAGAGDLDWQPWLSGVGATIFDCLQPWFLQQWLQIERHKGRIEDWGGLELRGRGHGLLLRELLTAAHAAQRVDLVRFLPRMLARLFGEKGLPLAFWVAGLKPENAPPRLAEQIQTRQQAIAVARLIEIFADWTAQFRMVPFYDEGYAQAQWWLNEWERLNGDRLVEQGLNLAREAEPLRTIGTNSGNSNESSLPD